MTIRRVVIDNSAPVWAKQLETDLNGTLAGVGNDISTATVAAAAAATNAVTASRLPTGAVVDSVYAEYTANVNLTTLLPVDDTIPQVTEGTQILSVTVTPKSVTNKFRARFRGIGSLSVLDNIAAALFLNGATSAIDATVATVPAANYFTSLSLEYEYIPGTLVAQTLTIRVGPNSGTMRMNGHSSARYMGGVMGTTLVVEEIKA